jgi:hypothetical protein
MPISRRHRIALDQRRERVADMYLSGMTQAAIGQEVGVRQCTISQDLKAIREQWRASAIRDFDLAREVELKKLDRMEREAWAAWERSKQPQQSATTEDVDHSRKTRRTVENRDGDPRFLEMVHKCVTSRCTILGLNATPRLEISNDGDSISERRDRVVTIALALGERARAGDTGTESGVIESRFVCGDSEPRQMETSTPPPLPGPCDS